MTAAGAAGPPTNHVPLPVIDEAEAEQGTVNSSGAGQALAASVGATARAAVGFRGAAQVVLNYLNASMPMAFWSITRVENDRQTHVYIKDNDFGLTTGGGGPWPDSFCVHMVAGTAPRIAPDVSAVPVYAALPVTQLAQIGAYAGAPIAEPDGTLFGVICGVDRIPRHELTQFGPVLDVLSELLTVALASDRAVNAAGAASRLALNGASTDPLTGIHDRQGWDEMIAELDLDFATHADPTAIAVISLDSLNLVNAGPGGPAAGDQLLRAAVEVIRREIRDEDFLASLGGDEFGIVLTNCEASLVPVMVRRLNEAFERAAISASIGCAALRLEVTVHRTIHLADEAMFEAKQLKRLSRPSTI